MGLNTCTENPMLGPCIRTTQRKVRHKSIPYIDAPPRPGAKKDEKTCMNTDLNHCATWSLVRINSRYFFLAGEVFCVATFGAKTPAETRVKSQPRVRNGDYQRRQNE